MNTVKRSASGLGSLLLVFAGSAAVAGHSPGTRYEFAPVVDVEPIVRVVRVERPRQECWDVEVYEEYPVQRYQGGGLSGPVRTAGPTIVGGLIGGLIGRQFGSGDGRDGMTLVGTLVGAAVAGDRARKRQFQAQSYSAGSYERRPTTVERCRTTTETFEQERIDGYDVTYEYLGERYTMRTDEPPGSQVKLRVSASPVRQY